MVKMESDSEYCGQDSTIETSINCLRNQPYQLQKLSPSASFLKGNSTSCVGISMDVVLRSTYDHVPASHPDQDHVALTDADARVYLKEVGWDVTKTVYHDGKLRWMYKAPPVNDQAPARALVFHTLCGAIEEYNNRIEDIAQGDERMARVAIVLRRKRPNSRNNTVSDSEENVMSNKRRPPPRLAAKKAQAPGRAETDSEPDVKPAAKEIFLRLSDLRETDDQDKSPTYVDSGNRSPVHMQPGIMAHGKTSKELEVVVNVTEAREYLVASGWEVSEVDRKYRLDWYYIAPESETYRAGTFQSLCGAISEYNSRVRFVNKTSTEQQPVLKLVRSKGSIRSYPEKRSTPMDEVKSAGMMMDEMEEKPDCRRRTGTTKSRPMNPSPCSSTKQGKRHSSEETELDVDNLGDSDQEKVSGNLLERFAAAANTSTVDVKGIVGKTFGTLVGNVDEDDRNYFLGIHILNLKKEHMRIFVEKDNLTIRATYSSESTSSKFSAVCSGALSCRLILPDDAIQESVTATQLKPGILNLTIPKSTKSQTKFEITIK